MEKADAASMLVRVQAVAFPLLLASSNWCPFDQEPTYGVLFKDGSVSLVGEEGEAENGVVIAQVYDRSPAVAAGLRGGDQVLKVNAQNVAKVSADQVTALVRRLTRARIQPLQLDIVRSGHRHRLYLASVPACQYSLLVIPTDQINALSTGRQVAVTTGLMRFVRSDDELAWVLAHEIAHNVLGHVENAKLQAMLNGLLGTRVGEPASLDPSPRFLEAQADYVGSYIMARAGYDLQAVRGVWQRLKQLEFQQASSEGKDLVRSHPATDERLASFEATVREIDEKRTRGALIEPVLERRGSLE